MYKGNAGDVGSGTTGVPTGTSAILYDKKFGIVRLVGNRFTNSRTYYRSDSKARGQKITRISRNIV